MKQFYLSFILCSIFVVSDAQEVEIIGGLSNPLNIQLSGNELFICEHASSPGNLGKVTKIDLADENPVTTTLASGMNYPRAITKFGNEIYFCNNTLQKFNSTIPNPPVEQVMNVSTTRSLIEYNGYLYLGRNNGIYRINLLSSPSITEVVTGLGAIPLGLTIKDDYLYLGFSNKVGRIDLTVANPTVEIIVENLDSNVYSLIFQDNTLLIGLSLFSEILKVDMDQSPYVAELFMNTTVGRVMDFAIWNDDLIVAGGNQHTIYKIEGLPDLLSLDEPQPVIGFKIYPNPSSDELNLFGITDSVSYEIYNLAGQLVLNGKK